MLATSESCKCLLAFALSRRRTTIFRTNVGDVLARGEDKGRLQDRGLRAKRLGCRGLPRRHAGRRTPQGERDARGYPQETGVLSTARVPLWLVCGQAYCMKQQQVIYAERDSDSFRRDFTTAAVKRVGRHSCTPGNYLILSI